MSNATPDTSPDLTKYEWMVRPCELYRDEYKDCTSFKSRFHQYFIYGETTDCSQWQRDLDNCERWESNGNVKSRDQLIQSERLRQAKRLEGHIRNTVWEDRTEPPADWNKPLPEWMEKENETTYLAIKAKELKDTPTAPLHQDRTLCVIS